MRKTHLAPHFCLPIGELFGTVHHMVTSTQTLDSAFHALADPTRRAVVTRLLDGPQPVKELAAPFQMGLPAFLKHLRVLEETRLIVTRKTGRVRMCQLRPDRLLEAETWLSEQRAHWEAGADRLAAFVEHQMSEETKE
ncbi:metalloregulator ArsR/SmtB family transcription factor [Mesorhizobium sp. CAU 1741]|uniref:ArsR/SmtB family transcription factor n=1 Tax=Mesorhizobium sp. CAU 1741 TaxID=3140366 RepID=UPI00325BF574